MESMDPSADSRKSDSNNKEPSAEKAKGFSSGSGAPASEPRFDLLGIVISRCLMFAALYAVSITLEGSPGLRVLATAYGLTTVLFLLLLLWRARRNHDRPSRTLFLQLLVEVPLETAIVWQGGGYLSDYALLYIMTILIGGLFLPVSGVFILTTLIVMLFGGIGLIQTGWLPNFQHALPEVPNDWVQMRFFLFTTLFYAVALLATEGSKRLAEMRRKLEGTERAMDVQRFRFAHMLHELPTGVLFFDAAFNLQYWNQAVADWFKVTFRRGMPLEDALKGLLDIESLQAMRLDGPLFPFTEMDIEGPEARPLHVQYKPLLQAGEFQGSVFILLDFTRERKWEEAMLHQERMAALGRLAARIAHEIRNPLASISGSAQMLDESPGMPESERKLLQLITHESKRLNRLLSDLLGYVRERKVQNRPVALRGLLGEWQLALENHPANRNGAMRIMASSPIPDPALVTDADLLHRILLNLGLNALEALDGKPGELSLHAEVEGELLRLEMTDNGPGMTEDVLAHAFEPFFTTKVQGTGLGLATCLHDVQILGGSINLSSPQGMGAVVTIRLPMQVELGEIDKHGHKTARIRKMAHS